MTQIKTERASLGFATGGEAPVGTLVALTSSFDLLESAEVQGNAAPRMGAGVGTPVVLRRR